MTSKPTSQEGSGAVPAVPDRAVAEPRSGRRTPPAAASGSTPPTPSGGMAAPHGGGPVPKQRTTVLRRLDKALARVGTAQELAQCLLDHLSPGVGADALLVYAALPEGAMRLVGHAGVEPGLAARWQQVPPLTGLPCVDTVRAGEPRWLERSEEQESDGARCPMSGDPAWRWPSQAWLPVVGGGITAAVGLLRPTDGPVPPPVRELLSAAVELCAHRVPQAFGTVTASAVPQGFSTVAAPAGAGGVGDGSRPALQAVLDVIPGPVVALTPLRSPSGEIEDYRIDAASPEAVDVHLRRGSQLPGLRLLECYPALAQEPVRRGLLTALATGTLYESGPSAYESCEGTGESSTYTVRAARLGDGLLVTWSRDSTARQEQRLADMQRLGNVGWANWHLDTDETSWSPQVFTIFGRDPALGPLTLKELLPHVLTEDLPSITQAVRELQRTGRAFDLPFRIRTARGVRHLRMVTESVADAQGRPVEAHGFVQDLTAQRSAELALAESERMMLTQHGMLQAERTLAARLQQALLPLPSEPVGLAGLRVDVAYLPAQSGLHVGGDWFSAIELPNGDALFVVGDVAGHGLDAVATMAQLRFTAKGMVITGSSLTGALTRLNALLLHSRDPRVTATMVLARYTPGERRLVWAQAGHPPPLLLRDGEARYLERPAGMLLGANTRASYTEEEFRLETGDRLLLFTDGLVERPSEGIDAGFGRLAEAVREHHTDEPSSLRPLLADMLRDERRDDVCVLDIRVAEDDEGAGEREGS